MQFKDLLYEWYLKILPKFRESSGECNFKDAESEMKTISVVGKCQTEKRANQVNRDIFFYNNAPKKT